MHVHILGICGTFMAGVAAIAREAGHKVTGSDQGVYPPMSDQLAGLGIDVVEGYEADQLKLNPDVVVVGNVMSRGQPLVEALLNSGIPYTSGPQWLAEAVLGSRRVIAVAGTHGKTTTASLLAWILEQAGRQPGFLIGGVARDFPVSARLGSGAEFVIEADEYDTAFFDKRAKFLHYRPEIATINNLEFDHADIYADLAAIRWQFHQLLRALPGRGRLITRHGDEAIDSLLAMGCWTPVDLFSSDPQGNAEWVGCVTADGHFQIRENGTVTGECAWQLTGQHNAENAVAAFLAARACGVEATVALEAIESFGGVRRRLESLGQFNGVELFDDFAHHPTAIERTIAGVKKSGDGGRVLVVLEPRSNSMKMGVHKERLAGALRGADHVWVHRPDDLGWDLAAATAGLPLDICEDTGAIVAQVASAARPGDRIVVMSNGGFEGIHGRLQEALAARG